MKSEIIRTDKERIVALEECEHKIINGFRRGLEATCSIAREFGKIEVQELYRDAGYEEFNEYLERRLGLELTSVRRIMAVSVTIENLRKAGMNLPENESQAAELARVEAEHQPIVWGLVLEEAERLDKRVTANAVRDAVKSYEQQNESREEEQEEEKPVRRGVTTALDLAESNGASKKSAKVPEQITFTEEGEEALERIGRLCGAPISKAILNGNLPMPERDLIKWSEQTDEMVSILAHYISDLRWSVARAIQFESQTLNEATTLGQLITLAKAHHGRYAEETDYYKFSLELVA